MPWEEGPYFFISPTPTPRLTAALPCDWWVWEIRKGSFSEEFNEWMNRLLEQIRGSPHLEISVATGHRLENIDQNLSLAQLL